MNYNLIAFLTLAALSSISNCQAVDVQNIKGFNQYLKENNKHYSNLAEYNMRFRLYLASVIKVAEINSREDTFTVGLNVFSDMTEEEKNAYKGKKVSPSYLAGQENMDFPQDRLLSVAFTDLEQNVDWKARNKVTSVKKQGKCGSCSSFATIALLESWLLIYADPNNQYPDGVQNLSEQQLVDCTYKSYKGYDNWGCDGGWNATNIKYMKNNLMRTETSYQYTEKLGTCKGSSGGIVRIYDYGIVPTRSTIQFLKQLAKGPIAVGLYVDDVLMSYKSGIYNHTRCKSSDYPNHSVLAVGYSLEEGNRYILCKNSWGSTWGDNGYFKISFDLVDITNGPCNMFDDGDNVYIKDPPSN